MIDDGELDWKIIAINENDPLFSELNDVGDVEAKLPGVISGKISKQYSHYVRLYILSSLQQDVFIYIHIHISSDCFCFHHHDDDELSYQQKK